VEPHPAALERHLRVVEELHTLPEHDLIAGNGEAARMLRELIGLVVLLPGGDGAWTDRDRWAASGTYRLA
jgi:hypothetical protein